MKIYIVQNDAWETISIHKNKKGAENKINALADEKFQKYSQSGLAGTTPATVEDFAAEYQIREVDLNEDENQKPTK